MTCSRSTSSRARPICRPSSFARRMPAFTRSTIRLLSSSAMAATMITMARPSAESVSTFSRKLMKLMFRRLSSSRTSRKCFTERAHPVERPDQHYVEAPAPGIGHKLIETGSLRFRSANRVAVLADNLETASRCQGTQITKLGLRVLVNAGNSGVDGDSFHWQSVTS